MAQMLTCMDDLAAPRPAKVAKGGEGASPGGVNADRHVLVIGQSRPLLVPAIAGLLPASVQMGRTCKSADAPVPLSRSLVSIVNSEFVFCHLLAWKSFRTG